jgi:hypothetical protein
MGLGRRSHFKTLSQGCRLKTLTDYYRAHRGKTSDKWKLYLDVYQELFEALQHKNISLLEIGIQNGGSLEIWAQYFPSGICFVGCDNDSKCATLRFEDKRICTIIGDASLSSTASIIKEQFKPFQIIIDDGSHMSSDIIRAFCLYFEHLEVGGIFIAEDLHCSYWSSHEGGLFDPFSAIAFFKRLADVTNHPHWGVSKSRTDLLQGFIARYALNLSERLLASIHSVQFLNSLCIIRKQPEQHNLLGARVVRGVIADVHDNLESLVDQALTPSQQDNTWSSMDRPPDESWERLNEQLTSLQNDAELLRKEQKEMLERALLAEAVLNQGKVELLEKATLISSLEKQSADRDLDIAGLRRENHLQKTMNDTLSNEMAQQSHAISNLTNETRFLQEKNNELESRVSNLQNLHELEVRKFQALLLEKTALEQQIEAVLSSTSWRITRVLRTVGQWVK